MALVYPVPNTDRTMHHSWGGGGGEERKKKPPKSDSVTAVDACNKDF